MVTQLHQVSFRRGKGPVNPLPTAVGAGLAMLLSWWPFSGTPDHTPPLTPVWTNWGGGLISGPRCVQSGPCQAPVSLKFPLPQIQVFPPSLFPGTGG